MASETGGKGEFHATITEVEPGLFRADYAGELNPDEPDARAFPDSHLTTSLDGAKSWVEQMAVGLGYSKVVWDSLP